MRKIFLSVLALLMTGIMCFTASGCVTEQPISFTSAFDTEKTLIPGGVETCTYDVSLQKDYNDELAASNSLQSIMDYSAVGTFTTTLEMVNADKDSDVQWKGSNLKDYDIKTLHSSILTSSINL